MFLLSFTCFERMLGNAEDFLRREFDIVGKETQAYKGRAMGFATREVSFDLASTSARPPKTSPAARAWRSFKALWQRGMLVAERIWDGAGRWSELVRVRDCVA